MMTTKT